MRLLSTQINTFLFAIDFFRLCSNVAAIEKRSYCIVSNVWGVGLATSSASKHLLSTQINTFGNVCDIVSTGMALKDNSVQMFQHKMPVNSIKRMPLQTRANSIFNAPIYFNAAISLSLGQFLSKLGNLINQSTQ